MRRALRKAAREIQVCARARVDAYRMNGRGGLADVEAMVAAVVVQELSKVRGGGEPQSATPDQRPEG